MSLGIIMKFDFMQRLWLCDVNNYGHYFDYKLENVRVSLSHKRDAKFDEMGNKVIK